MHKNDIDAYKTLLGHYLDVQKQLTIEELSGDELKGRWKSFLGKWNRGELAEGWYDPITREKAETAIIPSRFDRKESLAEPEVVKRQETAKPSEDEDEDEYGPTPLAATSGERLLGPSIPTLQDLEHRKELTEEEREARLADLRYDRKQDRKSQKERLEDLVPRADPGSRERQLEKKREIGAVNKSFKDAKESGDVEVGESELMGDDGVEGYKAKLKQVERKKTEKEIRKEEVLRARAEERGERMAVHRKKEDATMEMLKGLARQRYGGGRV